MDKRNIKNLLREMPFLRWVLTYHKQREDKYLAHLVHPTFHYWKNGLTVIPASSARTVLPGA